VDLEFVGSVTGDEWSGHKIWQLAALWGLAMSRRVQIGSTFELTVSEDDGLCHGKSKSLPRRVAIGREFEGRITSPKDWVEITDANTRTRIAWAVLGVIAVFLFGAAGLGFHRGEFGALQYVWSVVGPIYGGIAGYFYQRTQKK
jgi:hypothetical protein